MACYGRLERRWSEAAKGAIPIPIKRSLRLVFPIFRVRPGAGGRTRTDTACYGPRILSPVRLPFRHTGNL